MSNLSPIAKAERRAAVGLPWFTLWLVTIGYAHLSFVDGIPALLLWPYYLGRAIAAGAAR